MTRRTSVFVALVALTLGVTVGCHDAVERTAPLEPSHALFDAAPPPSGLVTLTVAGEQMQVWSYTGTDFSGAPLDPTARPTSRTFAPRFSGSTGIAAGTRFRRLCQRSTAPGVMRSAEC